MTQSLVLPFVPDNLRLGYGPNRVKPKLVESDVYDMCNRIKEVDPNLYVVLHEGHEQPFVIMENCIDGECRLVRRYAELHPGILDDLRYMLHVPFQKRLELLDKEIEASNSRIGHMSPERMERFAWEFKDSLQKSNFTQAPKPKNMPLNPVKVNATKSA